MKKAIIVGSGAGGATIARQLQGQFAVTVLEQGRRFVPFAWKMSWCEAFKRSGLLFDARQIQLFFPNMRIRKSRDAMILVNGVGHGGTTTLSTGNAVRYDHFLREIGLDLDTEFAEIEREIPISTAHQAGWRKMTRQLFAIGQQLALNPQPLPKMGDYAHCRHCGRCVLGCPYEVKWDSRQYLKEAVQNGAHLISACQVEKVHLENNRARGVVAWHRWRRHFYPADLIVIAAGGLGTPVILQHSGIPCSPTLFVDPVLCVATNWPGAHLESEISMPFVIEQPHFIISPYFDCLSYFFNRQWRPPAKNILSLMIKLADENQGHIRHRQIHKALTATDHTRLQAGVEICTRIFDQLGVPAKKLFLGTINAGHPGGMFP
ncbi:FAD-dependent oxidoreductase, partial [candidate division KSB1 bacterium]|nr:FAD-dependent oxidoreductase [candidate division KSB1 bacterium]